ncbi:MAG: beta-propeller domain-containing protein [Clostridia bacterium]|nr:beta-propeller domain-containing protein [Clostridia bacterium]
MMERYQKAMGRIHAPADTKKKLLGSAARPRRSRAAKLLPVAACMLVLVASCAVWVLTETGASLLPVGSSYDEIYDTWYAQRDDRLSILGGGGLAGEVDGDTYGDTTIMGGVSSSPSFDYSASDPKDYYETHSQTEGVKESDRQKTNGKFLWRIDGKTLYTYRLAGEDSELVSDLPLPEEAGFGSEMFLLEGRLAVITRCYKVPGLRFREYTRVYLYNLDAATGIPVLAEVFTQSGYYQDSRILGDTLYIVTDHNGYVGVPEEGEEIPPETYIPTVGKGATERALKPEEIYLTRDIPMGRVGLWFSVVSAIDLKGKEILSARAILGSSYTLYASTENLYLFAHADGTKTKVFRFAMAGEDTALTGSCQVKGTLLNQFAADEQDGCLRLATSVSRSIWIHEEHFSSQFNCVYVLDEDLQIRGALEKIQPEERIYSVRFSGDLCYLVTFQQMDPLFAIDLSDPSEPKILSELKVTGFSSYLYEYGEGLLLGFGVEGTENGSLTGRKLSMFDASDPEAVTEITSLKVSDDWGILYDHKKLMISEERGLIGIPLDGYQLYTYDREAREFVLLGHYELLENDVRGLYAGKYCYLVSGMGMTVVDLDTYQVVAKIEITV